MMGRVARTFAESREPLNGGNAAFGMQVKNSPEPPFERDVYIRARNEACARFKHRLVGLAARRALQRLGIIVPIRKNDFIFHAGYYVPIERIAFVMQPGGTAERHIRVLRPSNGIEGRVFLFTNSTPEWEEKFL